MTIEQKWYPLVLRLQSIGRKLRSGFTIVKVTIVVNEHGEPVFWLKPKAETLEPNVKGTEYFETLLKKLDH